MHTMCNRQSTEFRREPINANECVQQCCIFLFNFYVLECHLNSTISSFSTFIYMKLWNSINVKIFLLCFAGNSHLQKTIIDVIYVSAFDLIYREVSLFFRFLQNIIWQYSCMTLINMSAKTQPYTPSQFFQNHLL